MEFNLFEAARAAFQQEQDSHKKEVAGPALDRLTELFETLTIPAKFLDSALINVIDDEKATVLIDIPWQDGRTVTFQGVRDGGTSYAGILRNNTRYKVESLSELYQRMQ